jgi:pimeloyl-ACP methyl ester carboxylesterase
MFKHFLSSAAVMLLTGTAIAQSNHPASQLTLEPHTFESSSGQSVEAERGRFMVPENRANPDSRMIELGFIRFASTSANPGNPIVYLAGGPGGSGTGTARDRRWEIFMALRDVADVIAFDQRATGLSQSLPECVDPNPPSTAWALTRENMVAYYRAETARCLDWWRGEGIDIAAYNTQESAHDIDDLRQALGAEQIDLWGISYGTHLGMTYLKSYEDNAGRAVFAGFEGPDDTVKLPSRTDALFSRIEALIAADPAASQAYPDLTGMMRRVHDRLEAEPVAVTFTPRGSEEPVTITLGAFALQWLTGAMARDPGPISQLPALYMGMDMGNFDRPAMIIHQYLFSGAPSMRAMSTAMDLASGVSEARRGLVEIERQTSLLNDALNFPMPHLYGVAPEMDLGADFRAPAEVDTPILFINGTLDSRTYPQAARSAMQTLPNSHQMMVINGGHNIYEADPILQTIVADWFNGNDVPDQIEFDAPSFMIPGQ